MTRDINAIAVEIIHDWRSPAYGARPYLGAMLTMTSIDEDYGMDSGRSIIRYFLANAQTWRGEIARRIKAELKGML